MDFNVGDTVQLKSGGPAMTIGGVFVEDHEVQCEWFDRSSIRLHRFNVAMLVESKANLTLEELVCSSCDEKESESLSRKDGELDAYSR